MSPRPQLPLLLRSALPPLEAADMWTGAPSSVGIELSVLPRWEAGSRAAGLECVGRQAESLTGTPG